LRGEPTPGRTLARTAALCLLVGCGALCRVAAGEPVDGIVALVGSIGGDEGAATPVLESDVALGTALGDLLGGAVAGTAAERPEGDARAPLRRTILLALLARQARLSGEEVDPEARQVIIDRVTANAGGAAALAGLLERLGAGEADLASWASDVALAAQQVEYMRERIEPPSDKELLQRFERGDHPYAGLEFKDAKHRLRAFLVSEALRSVIAAQLAEAIDEGAVRMFR
jgi:hypothetical protein